MSSAISPICFELELGSALGGSVGFMMNVSTGSARIRASASSVNDPMFCLKRSEEIVQAEVCDSTIPVASPHRKVALVPVEIPASTVLPGLPALPIVIVPVDVPVLMLVVKLLLLFRLLFAPKKLNPALPCASPPNRALPAVWSDHKVVAVTLVPAAGAGRNKVSRFVIVTLALVAAMVEG